MRAARMVQDLRLGDVMPERLEPRHHQLDRRRVRAGMNLLPDCLRELTHLALLQVLTARERLQRLVSHEMN